MFPSSPNINLRLLRLVTNANSIGVSKYKCVSFKDVIGIAKSVTSREHHESRVHNYRIDRALKIQSFIYDGSKHAYIDGIIYKVERTYISGSFIEIYLGESNLVKDDIDDFPGWHDSKNRRYH